MSNLDKVVLQLRKERDGVQKRVEQLDQALAAQPAGEGASQPCRKNTVLDNLAGDEGLRLSELPVSPTWACEETPNNVWFKCSATAVKAPSLLPGTFDE